MGTITKFEDLEIWKLARKLCRDINTIIIETELNRDCQLKEQISRSSGSIMDNIAEGFERNGTKEFRQFLSIAKGSCGETRSQLYRIFDKNYIEKDKFNEMTVITNELGNKIGSFIKYLNYSDHKGTKFKS
jgi:four helix bundle protein